MKQVYKEKCSENLTASSRRLKLLEDMMTGAVPPDQKHALRLLREAQRLLDSTTDIVDIS